MNTQITSRLAMTALGAAAASALYVLWQMAEADILTGRLLLLMSALSASFFTALLAMAGPLSVLRAALGAGLIAVVVSGLLAVASFGFVSVYDVMDSPHAILGAAVLTLVPMPFWIAMQRGDWRDYGTLFGESWNIVVRAIAAWAFVGLVWAVIFLSDALLKVVGIDLIERALDLGPMRWVITGGVLGLGLAVVQELSDYVSPYLILRLLRLLLPVVFVVSAVFLLALPVRGVSGLFGQLSFALTLLAMAGAVATLVTTAVDQDDAQATQSHVLRRLARVLAVMLPVMAGLGAWAVWVRVAQYGWTPERVFAAEVAVLALGYGVLYAAAAVQGDAWMARVRQANVAMALALMALAAFALTPILSAERMSVNSLMARVQDGRTPVADLDATLLTRWGRPGNEALLVLEDRALQPGQEVLAQRLALARRATVSDNRTEVIADVVALMPLQPPGAAAIRDMYLELLDNYRLIALRDSCERQMPGGGVGCVMVVADLQPGVPGEEAVLLDYAPGGYVNFLGFRNDAQAGPMMREVLPADAVLPQYEAGADLIRAWQAAPPAMMPVPMNQLVLPQGGGLMLSP
ncbi:MAG: DUF4153 domain-containing protein [Paracoccaceae bacterium]